MTSQGPKKATGSSAATPADYRTAAVWFREIANANRIGVMALVSNGEQSVGDLSSALGISMSGVSRHLTRLRLCGLIQPKRRGQTMLYSLTPKGSQLLRIVEMVVR